MGTLLGAQDADLQSRILEVYSPSKAPAADRAQTPGVVGTPSLDLPRDNGQHADAPFERWVLRGTFAGPITGKSYGLEVLIVRQGATGLWRGSDAWRSDRWWIAQASLLLPSGRRLITEERLGREGLPAYASSSGLNLQVDGWTLIHRDGAMRLRLQLEKGQIDLEMTPQVTEVSLPLLESRNLHRIIHPNLSAHGSLSLESQTPLTVQGRFSLWHEWGNALPASLQGWDQAVLHFNDGRTWIFEGERGADMAFDSRCQLLEIDARGRLTRISKKPPVFLRRQWTSPTTPSRYPIAFKIQSGKENVGLDPLLEHQEVHTQRPGSAPYYAGICTLQDAHGGAIGDAFTEFTGYARPMRGF
jgi:predicted secreted hydrolase